MGPMCVHKYRREAGKPTHSEEMAKRDRGQERSEDALKRRGGTASLGTQLKSQEKQRNRSSRILGGAEPCQKPRIEPGETDSRLVAPRTVKTVNLCYFKPRGYNFSSRPRKLTHACFTGFPGARPFSFPSLFQWYLRDRSSPAHDPRTLLLPQDTFLPSTLFSLLPETILFLASGCP